MSTAREKKTLLRLRRGDLRRLRQSAKANMWLGTHAEELYGRLLGFFRAVLNASEAEGISVQLSVPVPWVARTKARARRGLMLGCEVQRPFELNPANLDTDESFEVALEAARRNRDAGDLEGALEYAIAAGELAAYDKGRQHSMTSDEEHAVYDDPSGRSARIWNVLRQVESMVVRLCQPPETKMVQGSQSNTKRLKSLLSRM